MSNIPLSVEPPTPNIHDKAPEKLIRQLQQSDQIFRLLVNSVKDYAIFILDPDGYVMTWNEGAQRIKGYSSEEILGSHFSVFYPDDSKQIGHPQKELQIARTEGRYEEEGWRVRKDGNVFWANVVITALFDQDNLIGFAKVTRDLTERRKAEQQREETTRLLAETNDELQHLAYVVSHELQAPLSTISRYGNLLSVRYRESLGEDATDFITKITAASKLTARMVDDLWTYARITKPNLSEEGVSMDNALSEAMSDLRESVADDEVVHSQLPSIRGNRQQFVYLFKELIQNAVKYRSAAAPRIQISAQSQDGGWVFSVKDNGIGIDKVYSTEVFRLFHRLKGGPEPTGTGMGLAMCRKIIQRHRGRIWFDSQPGSGTTIFFWLPES
jgi:PAS domain S-box-containing protein